MIEDKEEKLKEKFFIIDPFDENEKGFDEVKPIIDISVIVPIYNTEKYLEKCINSLLNQNTHFSYEILLVNDGSTDNSYNLLNNKYKDKYKGKVRILNKVNGGLSSARNYGIRFSRGEFISFVDSDDYVSSDFIEILMKNAIINKADIVKCGYIEFNNDTGRKIRTIKYRREELNINSKKFTKIKGHGCMCIIKRELFNDIRFPLGYLYEDMIMRFLIYPNCNKILLIDKPLYYYRINKNSLSRCITNKKNYKCLSQYFLLKEIIKQHHSLNIRENDNYYKCLLNELVTMMYLRTCHLEPQDINDIFELSCNLYRNNFKSQNYSYNLKEKISAISLNNRNIILWKLISIYNLIIIKYLLF